MASVWVAWGVSSLVLLAAAGLVAHFVKDNILAILVDGRNRFSLSRFQLTLWTIVVLGLLTGVFVGRLLAGVQDPLNVEIPSELLILMGISVGSAASASAIKAGKDLRGQTTTSASAPRFAQVVTSEEGAETDQTIDIAKFQNFWLTLIAVVAYVWTAIAYIGGFASAAALTALPGFDQSLLVLVGISHAGYLAGKLPDKK